MGKVEMDHEQRKKNKVIRESGRGLSCLLRAHTFLGWYSSSGLNQNREISAIRVNTDPPLE